MITSQATSQMLMQQQMMFAAAQQRAMQGQPKGFSYYNPQMSYAQGQNMGLQAVSAIRNIGAPMAEGAMTMAGIGMMLAPMSLGASLGVSGAMAAVYGAGSYGAGQMLTGAQNQAYLQSSLGSNYGHTLNPLSRTGRGFSRGQMQQVASAMKSVQDAWTDIGEIYKIVDSLGRMGYQMNQMNVQSFSQKMKQAVSTVRDLAKMMGTTMEEALPIFSEARRTGIYTTGDIIRHGAMRTGMSTLGFGQQQISGIGQMGSQISLAYGGLRGSGTRSAIRSAYRVGLAGINEEALLEATGAEGPEAYEALGGRLNQRAWGVARGAIGRRLIAGAAERGEDGKWHLNTGKLNAYAAGRMSLGEVTAGAGQGVGRMGAIGFRAHEHRLQGEMVEKIGTQLAIRDALRGFKPENISEDLARLLLKRRGGFQESELDAVMEVMRSMKTAERDEFEKTQQALENQFRESERKMHHSWEGVKRKIAYGLHRSTGQYFQQMGEAVLSGAESTHEDLSDWFFGRWRVSADRTTANQVMKDLLAGKDAFSGLGERQGDLGLKSGASKEVMRMVGSDSSLAAMHDEAVNPGFLDSIPGIGGRGKKKFTITMLRKMGKHAEADRLESGMFNNSEVENAFDQLTQGSLSDMSGKAIAGSLKATIEGISPEDSWDYAKRMVGTGALGAFGIPLALPALAGASGVLGVAGAGYGYLRSRSDNSQFQEYLKGADRSEVGKLRELLQNPEVAIQEFDRWRKTNPSAASKPREEAAEDYFSQGKMRFSNGRQVLNLLDRVRGNPKEKEKVSEALASIDLGKEAAGRWAIKERLSMGGRFLARRLSEQGYSGALSEEMKQMSSAMESGSGEGITRSWASAMERLSRLPQSAREEEYGRLTGLGGVGQNFVLAAQHGSLKGLKAKRYRSMDEATRALQTASGLDSATAKEMLGQYAKAGEDKSVTLTQDMISKMSTDTKQKYLQRALGATEKQAVDESSKVTVKAMEKLAACIDGSVMQVRIVKEGEKGVMGSDLSTVSNPDKAQGGRNT